MASSDEKDALMQLIMEHMDAEGMRDVKAVIQKKAAEKYGVAVASPVKGRYLDFTRLSHAHIMHLHYNNILVAFDIKLASLNPPIHLTLCCVTAKRTREAV